MVCDDGDACTTDGCNPLSGCTYTVIPGCSSINYLNYQAFTGVLALLPNPNEGSFQIQIDGIQEAYKIEMEIYDIIGRRVFTTITAPSSGRAVQLNTQLEDGLYMLQLRFNGEIYGKRFAVVKD